ncbi:MAG: ZIP family metal transporter [Patescibacteria group bacterium]|nr:ZIP family metal transporter [Patescibacteria group bacterium]
MLLLNKKLIKRISFYLVSFAAGALLATGFLDTLKESLELGGKNMLLWVTFSVAVFFLIERVFLSLHHHEDIEPLSKTEKIHLPTGLLIFGDALHNFIDGLSIAASFLSGFPLGLVTTLAVFIHEIPHELGDFGILIYKGWGRGKVFGFNALTGLTAIIGALLAFYLGNSFKSIIPVLLAITTGNFIYLSATDLLPEIHEKAKRGNALTHTAFFFLGIFLIVILIGIID